MGGNKGILIGLYCAVLSGCAPVHSTTKNKQSSGIVGGSAVSLPDPVRSTIVRLKTHYLNATSGNLETSKCSGVLIQQQMVLTAAHCLDFKSINRIEITNAEDETLNIFSDHGILIHEKYHDEASIVDRINVNDIALLRLTSPFRKQAEVMKLIDISQMAHHARAKDPPNSLLSFLAYGYGKQNGSLLRKDNSESLLQIPLGGTLPASTETSHSKDLGASLPYFEVDQQKGGICFGDSGGPAVIKNSQGTILIGIAIDVVFNPSRAFDPTYEPCKQKSVFLNLAYFNYWLTNAMTQKFY